MKLKKRKRTINGILHVECLIDGEYLTIREISEKFNIPIRLIRQRARKENATVKELCAPAKKPATFEINGEILTTGDIRKKYGLNCNLIHSRFIQGKRGSELVEPVRENVNGNKITFNGKVFNNKTCLSRELGIDNKTLEYRLKKSMKLDGPDYRNGKVSKCLANKFRGKVYSLNEFAKLCGIGKIQIQKKINSGDSLEDIFKYYEEKKRIFEMRKDKVTSRIRKVNIVSNYPREYLIKGEYLTIKEISEKFGIPKNTIRNRIARGLNENKIIELSK